MGFSPMEIFHQNYPCIYIWISTIFSLCTSTVEFCCLYLSATLNRTTLCWNNRIWWLCLVSTSTTRFARDLGYRMAKNLTGLYKENALYEQWRQIPKHRRTWYPSQILKTILNCMSQLFFKPQYVWFPSHLYVTLIPNSSGQLAELNVYIIPVV